MPTLAQCTSPAVRPLRAVKILPLEGCCAHICSDHSPQYQHIAVERDDGPITRAQLDVRSARKSCAFLRAQARKRLQDVLKVDDARHSDVALPDPQPKVLQGHSKSYLALRLKL